MTTWQTVFRDGLAPLLSLDALQSLREGLEDDNPTLIQGATTTPPPLYYVSDWPCEGADLIGFIGWQGEGLQTVGEVDDYFQRIICAIDQHMGIPLVSRYLLNAWDELPRKQIRTELLVEVDAAIATRMGEEEP